MADSAAGNPTVDHGRITQDDVARRAGVTRATVSMALKAHKSTPEKTRNRILRISAKLGYRPDPMLLDLAVYGCSSRPETFEGTLARLINSTFGYDWRKVTPFCDYHFGATRRGAVALDRFVIGRVFRSVRNRIST
jgi:transcriptional regulator with XRE-family HTH domain